MWRGSTSEFEAVALGHVGYKELISTRVASGARGPGEQKHESNYEDVSRDEDRTATASKGQEVPCRARPMGRARGRVEARLTEGD